MDIITNSVHIKGTSDPAGAIIAALCNFGTPEEPREPTGAEKWKVINHVMTELKQQGDCEQYAALLGGAFEFAPTPDDVVSLMSWMVQAHLDNTSRQRGYTDANFCVTYTASQIPQWQAEAVSFAAWRDSVWIAAISIMGDCKAGLRQPPTPEELLAELPEMVWP